MWTWCSHTARRSRANSSAKRKQTSSSARYNHPSKDNRFPPNVIPGQESPANRWTYKTWVTVKNQIVHVPTSDPMPMNTCQNVNGFNFTFRDWLDIANEIPIRILEDNRQIKSKAHTKWLPKVWDFGTQIRYQWGHHCYAWGWHLVSIGGTLKTTRTGSTKISIADTYQYHTSHWAQANHCKYYSGWH